MRICSIPAAPPPSANRAGVAEADRNVEAQPRAGPIEKLRRTNRYRISGSVFSIGSFNPRPLTSASAIAEKRAWTTRTRHSDGHLS